MYGAPYTHMLAYTVQICVNRPGKYTGCPNYSGFPGTAFKIIQGVKNFLGRGLSPPAPSPKHDVNACVCVCVCVCLRVCVCVCVCVCV